MKRLLLTVVLAALALVLATCAGRVAREVILRTIVEPQATREQICLATIGPQVFIYQQAEGCGDILYNPDKFAAWCRALCMEKHPDTASYGGPCDVAVPVVLSPHPEATGWDKDDARYHVYAVVFVPEQTSRLLRTALGWVPATNFCAQGYHAAWSDTGVDLAHAPWSDRVFVALPAGRTLRPGEREADDFFKAAAGMWQAAARKDRGRFLAARGSFKASDVFAGVFADKSSFTLSGEQLEAMARLLDEKVFQSIESTASR